ncbi:hypothetical protein NUW58_g4589 [Xylaria curta]|uniref:Uncharacterized protein n=1 Tax=Xylaria curta TaxID=42375 RepID=A0ACC1P684_9PEZI|nr:hypothetical protein NUW58_g4589 [Xylaria curta]
MATITRILAATFLLAYHATVCGSSLGNHLDGQDFGFSVAFPESGTSFSTSNPPGKPIAFQDFLNGPPQITLDNLPSNFTGSNALYISFIVYAFVSTGWNSLNESYKEFPWILVNQTLFENRTLGGGVDIGTGRLTNWLYHNQTSGDFKDASVNVWLQNPRLTDGLSWRKGAEATYYIAGAWLEPELAYPGSLNFQRSNIDFSIYNKTASDSPINVAAAQPTLWMGWLPLCIFASLLMT